MRENNVEREGGSRARIVAVCGVKDSGKTTLLEKLVQALARRGVKAAVIKHDGHDFTCDVPGTDSDRFRQAGAYGTAVFSRYRIFVHKVGTGEREEELARYFPEADILFFEGMKDSEYPKLEVVRREISGKPASNPRGRFLVVTDCSPEEIGEETAGFDEIGKILEKIGEVIGIDLGE